MTEDVTGHAAGHESGNATGGVALTLDLGNSSVSVACVGPAGAVRLAANKVGELDAQLLVGCLERAAAGGASPRFAAISAVGTLAEEQRLRGLLEGMGLGVVVNPDSGLELRLDHPETCGRDRLYGARGALEELGRGARPAGVLVVDAGTAVTVDAVLPTAAGGVFLGGAIAPGPGTLAEGLTQAGARLPDFTLRADAPALGRSTEEALQAGVVVGFRGAVELLARSIVEEAFGGAAGVEGFVTGGARHLAFDGVAAGLGRRPTEVELLVHLGLAAAARPCFP